MFNKYCLKTTMTRKELHIMKVRSQVWWERNRKELQKGTESDPVLFYQLFMFLSSVHSIQYRLCKITKLRNICHHVSDFIWDSIVLLNGMFKKAILQRESRKKLVSVRNYYNSRLTSIQWLKARNFPRKKSWF